MQRLLKLAARGAPIVLKLLVGLVVLGSSVNAWRQHVDDQRFPAPGMMVSVGDHRLHMHCVGEGTPTVVLDAGAGAWSSYFGRLQRALADSTRVCAYDRAGLGWSESGSGQFDIAASADELKRLLREANVPLPAILVGHSLGANIAAYYTAVYRDDVAGTVLVDPGAPEDWVDGYAGSDADAKNIMRCGWKCGVASGAAYLGVVRAAAKLANPGGKNLSDSERAEYQAGIVRARTLRATLGALVFLPKSAVQTREARAFGDVPMTVVYSADTRKPQGKETVADVAAWHALTLDRMRVMLQGTARGRGPIVVEGVTHTTVALDSAGVRTIVFETLRLAALARLQTP